MYQTIVRNAAVVDGTGKPAFSADVGIKDGKIVMRPDLSLGAEEIIDAAGLVLSPGFIDAHCHSDETVGNDVSNLAKSSQGITTEFTGHCGESLYPVSSDPVKRDLLAGFLSSYLTSDDCGYKEEFASFTSLENFRKYLESRKSTTNYAMLTGHIALRIAVMGFENREATPEEIEQMKKLLREAMEHGSMGMSSGLLYSPSCYATDEEVLELCKVVAEYDGYYATHLRDEAGNFEQSVQEAINIAEKAGCRLNLSHHKVCGREHWGKTRKTLQMIEDAHARGMKIHTDVYPYTATGNYLNICLPKEFFAHGHEKMAKLLKDPAVRAELIPEIINRDGRYRQCGGFANIVINSAPSAPESAGKSVAQYARELGRDAFDVYFDLVIENGQAATAAYFSMSEEDLERILLNDFAVLCTDSFDLCGEKAVHPRCFGSFPKCLGYYVRERKLMPLETMIHKMTQAPAVFLQLKNKGVIADGYDADLVLFDPKTVSDRADFENSHARSVGIERVFVAGQTVYQDGALTGTYPGKFIPYRT